MPTNPLSGLYQDEAEADSTRAKNPLAGLYADSESAEPERTVLGTLGDVGVTAAKGVVGLGEAVVGVGNLATGGMSGKGLEMLGVRFKETHKILDDLYSDAQKAANKRVEDSVDPKAGLVDKTLQRGKAMLSNPSTVAEGVGESIPSVFGGGAIAKTDRKSVV